MESMEMIHLTESINQKPDKITAKCETYMENNINENYFNQQLPVQEEFSINGLKETSMENNLQSALCLIRKFQENNDLQNGNIEEPVNLRNNKPLQTYRKVNNQYACKICRKNCLTSYKRRKHMGSHFLKNAIFYCHCGEYFLHQKLFNVHQYSHIVKSQIKFNTDSHNTNYVCKWCFLIFQSNEDLTFHIFEEHTVQIENNSFGAKCKYCLKIFTNSLNFKKHLALHFANYPFINFKKKITCVICSKNFTNWFNLSNHMNKHLNKKSNIISKKIKYNKPLLKIYLKKHFKKRTKYSQEVGNTFENLNLVESSLLQVSMFSGCPNCDKIFPNEQSLEKHIRANDLINCHICNDLCCEDFISNHLKKHPKTTYVCEICKRPFTLKVNFDTHMRCELNLRHKSKLECKLCFQHFFQQDTLTKHMSSNHGINNKKPVLKKKSNEVKCDICKKSFVNKFMLDIHTTNIHTEYKCSFCRNKTFFSKNKLRIHIRDKHNSSNDYSNKSLFECSNCEKKFISIIDYRSHITNHYNGKCKICNFEINTTVWELTKHLETHIDEKNFTCEICNKEFGSKKGLKIHLMAEQKEKQEKLFECKICSLNYYHKNGLNFHLIRTHKPDFSDINKDPNIPNEEPSFLYKCPTCQYGTNDEEVYQRHLIKHEYLEKCIFCGKIFTTPKDFNAHFDDHVEGYPYTCKICSKSFVKQKFKKHLKIEQRRLTKKALFTCEICQKGFFRQITLDTHINNVHGKKTLSDYIECHICHKNFENELGYQIHYRMHTVDSFEVCKVCSKEFSARTKLKYHTERHLTERPYTCLICFRMFDAKMKLREHLWFEQIKTKDLIKCEFCGVHYFNRIDLDKHRMEHKFQDLDIIFTDKNLFDMEINDFKHFLDFQD